MLSRPGTSPLLLAVVLLQLAQAAGAGICGDCDGSGAVTITDALWSSQMAVGVRAWELDDLHACDADSSGSIEILDALLIAQDSVGISVPLVCPPQLLAMVSGLSLDSSPTGVVMIGYLLTDADSDPCDLVCLASLDGGLTFPITATPAPGGDGTTGLASSPLGVMHTFAWDSAADTGPVTEFTVELRLLPLDPAPGTPGYLGPLIIDNRPPGVVSYALDIVPLTHDVVPLGVGCTGCHSGSTPPAALDLSSYTAMMAGGATGAVVIPGDPDMSIIVCKVEGGGGCGPRMPFGGTAWNPTETQLMRDWIAQGALDN